MPQGTNVYIQLHVRAVGRVDHQELLGVLETTALQHLGKSNTSGRPMASLERDGVGKVICNYRINGLHDYFMLFIGVPPVAWERILDWRASDHYH
jgi:hypothetical protein